MAENKTEVKSYPKDEMDLETEVQRDPGQDFSKIDNEVVMLSLKNGEYYALNEVASRIWDIISVRKKVKEIVDELMSEYDISHETCTNDTIECLLHFRQKKLLM